MSDAAASIPNSGIDAYVRRKQDTTSQRINQLLTTNRVTKLPYSNDDLNLIFDYANEHNLDNFGRYDVGDNTITIWSEDWGGSYRSERLGTLYFGWGDGDEPSNLVMLQSDRDVSLYQLYVELGIMEQASLGRKVHGV